MDADLIKPDFSWTVTIEPDAGEGEKFIGTYTTQEAADAACKEGASKWQGWTHITVEKAYFDKPKRM